MVFSAEGQRAGAARRRAAALPPNVKRKEIMCKTFPYGCFPSECAAIEDVCEEVKWAATRDAAAFDNRTLGLV